MWPSGCRYLAETVASVPHFAPDDFEKLLTDNQNDGESSLAAGGQPHHAMAAHSGAASGATAAAPRSDSACCPGMLAGLAGTPAATGPCPVSAPALLPATPPPTSSLRHAVTLVMFLSHLIRAHIALADKLGTMQLPLL